MTQITDIIISSAMGILTILAGIAVQAVKVYLIKKGGRSQFFKLLLLRFVGHQPRFVFGMQ